MSLKRTKGFRDRGKKAKCVQGWEYQDKSGRMGETGQKGAGMGCKQDQRRQGWCGNRTKVGMDGGIRIEGGRDGGIRTKMAGWGNRTKVRQDGETVENVVGIGWKQDKRLQGWDYQD